jgi:hypothetical protein
VFYKGFAIGFDGGLALVTRRNCCTFCSHVGSLVRSSKTVYLPAWSDDHDELSLLVEEGEFINHHHY